MDAHRTAEEYAEEADRLDPIEAFMRGDLNYSGQLTDFSPEAERERHELVGRYLRRAEADPGEEEGVARGAMLDRLQVASDLFEAGEWARALHVFGPHVQVRQSFDLLSRTTEEQWEVIALKLRQVPGTLLGFRRTLEHGLERHLLAARRQALVAATQCRAWGGGSGASSGYFTSLVATYPGTARALGADLTRGAAAADRAYLDLADHLERSYTPRALETDGVGPERYALAARRYLGTRLDPVADYEFGWSELARLTAEMAEVAERIAPGAGVDGAVALLEADPARAIEGVDRFRAWSQELLDETVSQLQGAHFEIPPPVRRVEAMIAPPGGSPAMYYTPPSADFTRPGRTWYPTLGRTRFPLWQEVTTSYHEGLPGHHLQLGAICFLQSGLGPFQTLRGAVSGHVEGWALYAERLMGELGFLRVDDYRLGMLSAQAMRAARVVVDLGLHLQLAIPAGQPFHPGERWTWELAVRFLMASSRRSREFCSGEVDRYLGVPAQAISYKLGERVWLEVREAVRRRQGARFELKSFHRQALALGCLGLDQLRQEMERLA
ncbi:MAG: DUF885 domain-containing protein [Candidatus Dormibacteraeota bacterium]|nr:DUF885 domain-containing protein [Candidatus Dormibacteraeota bacterium]